MRLFVTLALDAFVLPDAFAHKQLGDTTTRARDRRYAVWSEDDQG